MSPFTRHPHIRFLAPLALAVGILTGAGYSVAMAPTATGSFSVSLSTTQSNVVDFGTASFKATLTPPQVTYQTSGTGTNQIDRSWSDSSRVLASAADTLDLAGVLTDGFGQTFTCAKMKSFLIYAMPGNTNNVEVTGGNTAGHAGFLKDTSDVLVVKPGYAMGIGGGGTGYTVTATTGDKWIIRNSGGTTAVSYKVELACTSA